VLPVCLNLYIALLVLGTKYDIVKEAAQELGFKLTNTRNPKT